MFKNLNRVIFLIIFIETLLLYILTKNYAIAILGICQLFTVIVILKYCITKEIRLPKYLLSILVFLSYLYFIDLNSKNFIINSILTFHWIVWADNIWQFKVKQTLQNQKTGIDIGINRFSLFFLSVLCMVYFALNCREIVSHSFISELIGLSLLALNFLVLLFSNIMIRFKSFQGFGNLLFSSTIIAILILFISGPYVVSTITPNPILIKNNEKAEKLIQNTPKKNVFRKKDKQTVGYSNDLSLSKTTDIKKEHLPELFLKIENDTNGESLKTGKIYLKGASYDTYVNNHWSNYYDNPQWLEDGINNSTDGVIRLQENPKKLQILKQEVFQLNGWNGNIFALPNITEIHMDKVLAEENETYFVPVATGNQIKYKVIGGYTSYEDIDKSNLVSVKKSKKYLMMLGDACSQIKNKTLDIIKTEKTDAEKIESILYFFRQNFRYSLKTENKESIDPLENFFFHEKKGHCELYATALVIMLRSANIPSRISIGYCGGEFIKDIQSYVFYSDEAHAWAEVYFEDYGWVVIDATPATHNPNENLLDPSVLSFDSNQFSEFGPNEKKIKDSRIERGLMGMLEIVFLAASKDPILMINLILLTYPISFFLIFGIFKFLRSRKNDRNEDIKKTPNFILELYRLFGRKAKGDTLLEYLNKIKSEKFAHESFDDVLEYYYNIHYGKGQPNSEIESQLLIKIISLKSLIKQKS